MSRSLGSGRSQLPSWRGAAAALPDDVQRAVDEAVDARLRAQLAGGQVFPSITPRSLQVEALTPSGTKGRVLVDDGRLATWQGDQVPWTLLPLQTGYSHYGAPFGPCNFMKDALGTVFVRGLVQTDAGAASLLIGQLPVGCRPARQVVMPIMTSGGLQRFDLYESGFVSSSSLAVGSWSSLFFSFKAEG